VATALPSRPNLDWLRKTARQLLKQRRARDPRAKLADVQLAMAREYGFTSWRALKAHVDAIQRTAPSDAELITDADVATFLRAVGGGALSLVRASLKATPQLVNALGPHPYWPGRPQALHVSIETSRQDMFDLLVESGADVNGSNESYEQSSPLMLTFLWDQAQMRETLLTRGAKIGLVEALLLRDDARVASILRRSSSNVAKLRPNGGSILAMARTPFAIDLLLELGAPPDIPDRWGTAPLEAMSRLGAAGQPLFQHLLGKGFDASPREYARMGDRNSLAKLFERHPESVRAHDVLAEAAGFGHYDLVEWLLAHGAHVNSGEEGAWTALHSAAWEGHLQMVKLLVAAGADLSATESRHDSTPARVARAAIAVTNNPACEEVARYLDGVERGE